MAIRNMAKVVVYKWTKDEEIVDGRCILVISLPAITTGLGSLPFSQDLRSLDSGGCVYKTKHVHHLTS